MLGLTSTYIPTIMMIQHQCKMIWIQMALENDSKDNVDLNDLAEEPANNSDDLDAPTNLPTPDEAINQSSGNGFNDTMQNDTITISETAHVSTLTPI